MRAAAVSSRPFAIIVTEGSYQSDPDGFDAAARELEASLMRLDMEEARRPGAHLLADAVFESAATTDANGTRPALC
jgi:hypothetical protein